MKKLLLIVTILATVIGLTYPTYAMSAELRQAQAEEQNLYNNEILFRGIPWGTPYSETLQMLSDIVDPSTVKCSMWGSSNICQNVGLDTWFGDINPEAVDGVSVTSCVRLITPEASQYEVLKDSETVINSLEVAGHPVEQIWLFFVDDDLNPNTEQVFFKAFYQFAWYTAIDYNESIDIYTDIQRKIATMYSGNGHYENSDTLSLDIVDEFTDYNSNDLHLYYSWYENDVCISLQYYSSYTLVYGEMITTTYFNNLHATWDTNGL